MKAKKVELIELFYDLIYVYAVSRLTALIEEPHNGMIAPYDFFKYLIMAFVILQAWLYLTNYVNRYGHWRWWEYGITAVNMIAAIYLSNTISNDWEQMYIPFNIAMFVMLLCVAVMYLIQTVSNKENAGAAKNSLTILSFVGLTYIAAFVAMLFGSANVVIWLDVAAVLLGAFLPFFIRGKFDKGIINFPHLVERFELLTIITFGESIVGMTGYFDVRNFTMIPVIIFLIVILLFGSYVTQIHYLCDHHRNERALKLMFSHYFIVIAVNLITVNLHLIQNSEINHIFVAVLMIAAIIIFYTAIYSNSSYYRDGVRFGKTDIGVTIGIAVTGAALIMLFRDNLYGLLIGALFMTAGNFLWLIRKYNTIKRAVR